MKSNARKSVVQDHKELEDVKVPVRLKLSALWVSVMLMYVYVDIFGFYKPGTIDGILVGRVWQFDINQTWAFGALALMTIPSLMVALALTLPARAARWANLVIAPIYLLVTISNPIGETWVFMWLGSAVEAVLLLFIIRYAWTWPHRSLATDGTPLPPSAVTRA